MSHLIVLLSLSLWIFSILSSTFIIPYQSCLNDKNEEWLWVTKSLVSKCFLHCEVLCAKIECVMAAASSPNHRAAEEIFLLSSIVFSLQIPYPLPNLWHMDSPLISYSKVCSILKCCNIFGQISSCHYSINDLTPMLTQTLSFCPSMTTEEVLLI